MPALSSQDLYQALLERELVDAKKLATALTVSEKNQVSLSEQLLKDDLIDEDNLGKIIADLVGYPYVALTQVSIPSQLLNLIPESFAQSQQTVLFKQDQRGWHVAMAEPDNQAIKDLLTKKLGSPINFYYATPRNISRGIELYSQNAQQAFTEIINESAVKAQHAAKPEPPIIKIVDTFIKQAYRERASDIHIEPLENKVLVRFRIDGVLHDVIDLPADLHSQIITRIKVLAHLRTDEHQAAQDGKISYPMEEEDLDIRVSVVPITRGEKAALRLLSERSRQFSLQDLGLSAEDLQKIDTAYAQPHGMILATGPTGSGKTTTLYSVLKLLNKREINIMTIEDPVEYNITNVNQIQVNQATGLTFAHGLRSIVRQDPDIILVGEIRDEETADIAINAATTGHLVLSTLHTNDAATTIPRLLDLKVEPYLISSTVNLIISQRLVREICPRCRVSQEVKRKQFTAEIQKYLPQTDTFSVYRAKGCPVCHSSGYLGRVGVFEVMLMNDELREAIDQRANTSTIQKIAARAGMKTMLEDGLVKALAGVTTIEEILRVTKE